jgi:hypothetical protein
VLAAAAIEYLLGSHIPIEGGGVGIAWFYCDYTNEDKMKTVEQTLACLLRQLLESHTVLPDPVITLFNTHKAANFRKAPLTEKELFNLLQSTVATFSKVILVIDALDEYPSGIRTQFLEVLNSLQPSHLLLTSREHIRVGDVISEHKIIPIHATEHDIMSYVHSRLRTFHLARQINARSELKDEIISAVVSNAGNL